ncbi:MAG: hypothetical protein PHW96_02760 [Candidatus Nanoarchaeia archaeon]|nr:hypothetical protein [Candidatus Nanoarchaeia archaeon]
MEIELTTDFNLNKTLNYKPFLFLFKQKPERTVKYKNTLINLTLNQNNNLLNIETDRKVDENFVNRIRYCLGAEENLEQFYMLCRNDKVLSDYIDKIKGIRIVSAFSDFEALVSIICSQMVGFEQYLKTLVKIYDSYGYFPEKEDILEKPEKLDSCSLGYRKKFILNLAENYGKVPIEKIKGLGAYSINIFNIFQKRNYSFFYKDCLIDKIAREYYNSVDSVELSRNWGDWRGLAEVYLQKFLRDN